LHKDIGQAPIIAVHYAQALRSASVFELRSRIGASGPRIKCTVRQRISSKLRGLRAFCNGHSGWNYPAKRVNGLDNFSIEVKVQTLATSAGDNCGDSGCCERSSTLLIQLDIGQSCDEVRHTRSCTTLVVAAILELLYDGHRGRACAICVCSYQPLGQNKLVYNNEIMLNEKDH
jgi:hypothetical protein